MAVATGSRAPKEPAEAPKAQTKTPYVVLVRVAATESAPESWAVAGEGEGASRLDAIKAVLGGEKASPGSYKAVPTRSWQETVEVGSETKTVVSFKPAGSPG